MLGIIHMKSQIKSCFIVICVRKMSTRSFNPSLSNVIFEVSQFFILISRSFAKENSILYRVILYKSMLFSQKFGGLVDTKVHIP